MNTSTDTTTHKAYSEMDLQRTTLRVAWFLSGLFRPQYFPLVAIFVLLNFTFLQMLPLGLRIYILGGVFLITCIFPIVVKWLYRYSRLHVGTRHPHQLADRLVPYIVNLLCNIGCMYFVWNMHLPSFVLCIVAVYVCIYCICTLIATRWNISSHSAAAGAPIGCLVVYAALFGFNPVWWLCWLILMSGLVDCSRMVLRRHTLAQVLAGTWVGIVCGFLGILLI